MCYVAALIPCMVMAFAQPALSRVDEQAHIDVITQYAGGKWPSGVTVVTPDTIDLMRITQTFGWNAAVPAPRPPYDRPQPRPPHMTLAAQQLWITRHFWQYSYEATQPPLYYMFATPAWVAIRSIGGPLPAVYALRFLNALLAALMAPLTLVLAMQLAPARRWLALAAAVIAGSVPGTVINLTQVTNDTLAIVLGAAALVMAVRLVRRGGGYRTVLAMGLLLGLGVVTKVTAAGLVVALAFAVVVAKPRGQAWRRLGLLVATIGVCLAPWLALNVATFGSLTQQAAAVSLNTTPVHQPSFGAVVVELLYLLVTGIAGEPLSAAMRPAFPLLAVGLVALGLAGAGWLRALRAGSPRSGQLWTVVLAVIAEIGFTCLIPAFLGSGFNAPGRYAASALGGLVILLALGISRELRTPARNVVAGCVVLACIATALTADLASGLRPYATELSGPPASAATVPLSASAAVDGFTVSVDRAGFDRRGQDLWIHVAAVNLGSGYAEWDPLASASVGGTEVGVADGRQVNQFAGRLDPGHSTAGWLLIALPANTDDASALSLRFADVATSNYSHVQSILVPLPIDR